MEIEYRGYRIVETEVETECFGFPMTKAFKVLDEFDDPLPILQNLHWSPGDARLSIDFVHDVFKVTKKWPTTQTHEFNIALAYRANFVQVYQTLQSVKKVLADCQEMGDDPTAEVSSLLHGLHVSSVSGRH